MRHCMVTQKIDTWDTIFFSATGGELFDRLFERGKFTEKDAIAVVRSILAGLQYLHSHNIVHRGMLQQQQQTWAAW